MARVPGQKLTWSLTLLLIIAPLAVALTPGVARAAALPAGFAEEVVFGGLVNPTAIRFAPDGRVFVAEKRGVLKVFDHLADPTPDIFADLNVNVYNFWDRGLLGLALDPDFATNPWVYVLYTYDHELGSAAPAPRWGTPGVYSDPCPTPPGATGDGCVVSGRLSRLPASLTSNAAQGGEQVLIEDWCQQYPSHSVGSLAFGPDGALYVSGGDGASFNWVDYGQDGSPVNPCGDPGGTSPAPPSAEGGALRSQDLRTGGDPTGLDGAILRVDRSTGAGLPDNPLAGSADPNARRIVAHGLRNPFRITTRPGTSEVWIGDVGWTDWEEIDRIPDPADATVENFGWPCYEGVNRQPGYDGANLASCENLYAAGPAAVTAPHFAYHHSSRVVAGESCPTGSSAVAGLAFQFYAGGSYPAEYDGALFFADNSRDCIWAMMKGANGLPAPGLIRTFVAGAANPVDLQIGPGGDLFYADFDGGTIRRIRYVGDTPPPTCPPGQYQAQYFNGMTLEGAPALARCEDAIDYNWGTGSPAPGIAADRFSVRWSGQFAFAGGDYTFTATADDGIRVFLDGVAIIDQWRDQGATTYTATITLAQASHEVKVEYYENTVDAVARVGWQAIGAPPPGDRPPVPTIAAPAAGTTWKVGDRISFAGSASDPEDGALPGSALSWELILHHCPSNCHTHPIQSWAGAAGGSFTAPDHEYPSYLELRLTATDSGGQQATATRRLDPQTVVLTFQSNPGGLQLTVDGSSGTATFSRTVIVGSNHTVSAAPSQTKGRQTYTFASWSDGGAQTHTIVAPASATTYTARYRNK
jgi:glucose/arabinose dehydrogenase